MPDLESLSFALLIPFSICFVILFLVCCFADKLKQVMCLPSPLPQTYSRGNDHRRRRSNNRNARHFRSQNSVLEEHRILIGNDAGRERNISESSSDSNDTNSAYADVYSRMGVLPAYILISSPINNPNAVNSARHMTPVNSLNTFQTVSNVPRPGIVVIQR